MSFKHTNIECYSFFLHQKQGASIVLDPEKDKSMVQDLLDFKEQLDSIIEDAFMRSEKFVNSMKVRTVFYHTLYVHVHLCIVQSCWQRNCRLLPYLAGGMSPYLSLWGQMMSVIKTVLVNSFWAGNIVKAAASEDKILLSLTKFNVGSLPRFTHKYFVHIIFSLFVCLFLWTQWLVL